MYCEIILLNSKIIVILFFKNNAVIILDLKRQLLGLGDIMNMLEELLCIILNESDIKDIYHNITQTFCTCKLLSACLLGFCELDLVVEEGLSA